MFSRETLELGPVPASEPCQQVDGINTDYYAMKAECNRYKAQLEAIFPQYQQYDCQFAVKTYSHDFGAYMEVVIYFYPVEYEDDDETSQDFAFFVESHLPSTWDDMNVRRFEQWQSSAIAEAFINA